MGGPQPGDVHRPRRSQGLGDGGSQRLQRLSPARLRAGTPEPPARAQTAPHLQVLQNPLRGGEVRLHLQAHPGRGLQVAGQLQRRAGVRAGGAGGSSGSRAATAPK